MYPHVFTKIGFIFRYILFIRYCVYLYSHKDSFNHTLIEEKMNVMALGDIMVSS